VQNIKVSIITVCFNSAGTIHDSINSVIQQSYPNIEYIIIDGASTDGTRDIINSFAPKITKYISEGDNGLYDALNKGIKLASGHVVGILNSDDFFYDCTVIENIVKAFTDNNIDVVIGDVQFVDPIKTSKVVRYYSSKRFTPEKFRFGIMPAHPGFYAKRELFEKFGYYKTDYKIAADFELLLRFLLIHRIRYKYLEMPFVSMRRGGVSNKSIGSNITLNKEIARACRENGISTNYFLIYLKYFTKIFQFFSKKVTR